MSVCLSLSALTYGTRDWCVTSTPEILLVLEISDRCVLLREYRRLCLTTSVGRMILIIGIGQNIKALKTGIRIKEVGGIYLKSGTLLKKTNFLMLQ